jgi:hypothetical protein
MKFLFQSGWRAHEMKAYHYPLPIDTFIYLHCLTCCLLGCQDAGNKAGVDEKEIQGFKTKTFLNNSGNIEVTIATDGKSTIVAVPKVSISRRNQMGDDEYTCLKACKDIADLESRLNCILRCPVTKQYQVFIF